MIVQASAVAHWLEDCQTTIDEACAPHENINASQKELLKNCSTIMHSLDHVHGLEPGGPALAGCEQ